MKDQIKAVESLIKDLSDQPWQTPALDVAIGGLRTFITFAKEHEAELARRDAARQAEKPKTK